MSTGIDLHLHSTSSDGTQSPRELVFAAARSGLHSIALTDHDTIDGWAEAQQAAHECGLDLLLGAEISIDLAGISMHLLAYGFDTDPDLLHAMQDTCTSRAGRAQHMVELLARDYPITWEGVLAQAEPGATIGRPHIADALVQAGVVRNRDEAFASMLNAQGGYYVDYPSADAVTTITQVRQAGGAAVLAHPWAPQRGLRPSVEDLRTLVDAGLHGWEVDHPDHEPAIREELRDLALDWDVLQLGSSDYHGLGKSTPIGACTTDPEEFSRLLSLLRG